MNNEQFKTLAELMRLRPGSANYRGAQLVMVDGHSVPVAARMLAAEMGSDSKMVYPTLFNSVKRIKLFVAKCKLIVDV
jgi:hypothetical protein